MERTMGHLLKGFTEGLYEGLKLRQQRQLQEKELELREKDIARKGEYGEKLLELRGEVERTKSENQKMRLAISDRAETRKDEYGDRNLDIKEKLANSTVSRKTQDDDTKLSNQFNQFTKTLEKLGEEREMTAKRLGMVRNEEAKAALQKRLDDLDGDIDSMKGEKDAIQSRLKSKRGVKDTAMADPAAAPEAAPAKKTSPAYSQYSGFLNNAQSMDELQQVANAADSKITSQAEREEFKKALKAKLLQLKKESDVSTIMKPNQPVGR